MLGKLIKYDFKALKKTLLPLCFGAVALSVFVTLLMKLFFLYKDYSYNLSRVLDDIFGTVLTLLLIFGFLGLVAAAIVSWFLILKRYYQNLFKDDGYLTFTLPVKTSGILLSKLISSTIWSFITALFAIVSIAIFVVFGTSRQFINMDAIDTFSRIWEAYWSTPLLTLKDYIIIPIIFTLLVLSSVVQNILLLFLAITLGNQVSRKHKILGSVGMYFVVNTVASIIVSTAMILLTYAGLEQIDNDSIFSITPGMDIVYIYLSVVIVISTALSVAYFFVNKYILKNHLNLE